MSLTPKQEKFVQCVADGMSQSDAYRTAYDCKPTTKPETIQAHASRLMADGKVSARLKEIRAALESRSLWSREMSVKALIDAYKMAKINGQSTGMTSAVKELNAMHGYNEPTKLAIQTPSQIVIVRAGKELK